MENQETSLLQSKMREVERDLEAAAQSEMMLLESLLGKTVDASSFRARIQGAWSMMGMVSALFLTMDQYNNVVICPADMQVKVPFCQQVHPCLSGIATAFAAASVVLSMVLYVQMSFVPDEFLGAWMSKLSFAVDFPLFSFIVSILGWGLTMLWRGILNYGILGYVISVMVAILGSVILFFFLKVKTMTNKYLISAAAAAKAS
ncbi:Uncharacterized protein SCF082_LOCUS24836 [Durusdinium trenchii]|uniref:Vesicle transport protein n=1 Tax=Durusdinium trenchii TaxID=1381693 RepID=A0ABP0LW72_9DINO